MNVCDYARSFITFVVPGNSARIGVEARCLLQSPDGGTEEFLMFASCKSEDTYAERDLFRIPETNPSYDFSGMFSPDRFRIERVFVSSEREALDTGLIADRFTEVRRHVVEAPATALLTKEAVIEATLAGRIVIARNEITDEASGVTAVLEYPVKTMNVNAERGMFQTLPMIAPRSCAVSAGPTAPSTSSRARTSSARRRRRSWPRAGKSPAAVTTRRSSTAHRR
jgi:hypothetical protein